METQVSGSISWRSPSTSTQPGAHADLVEAHELGGDPVAGAEVGAVLGAGGTHALEAPVERDRLHVVGLEDEADGLQRLDDLVADRPDDGELGFGRQPPAGAHRDLLDAPRDPGVRVHHVAVDVLAEPEAELEAAVVRRGHRADLLRPRRIARPDVREGLGDLVAELLVGRNELADLVFHGILRVGMRAAGWIAVRPPSTASMSSTRNARSRIETFGVFGRGQLAEVHGAAHRAQSTRSPARTAA